MDHPGVPIVYICYSDADQDRVEELLTYLQPAITNGLLDCWSHEKISPGSLRRDTIKAAIGSAEVAVLCVSSDFFVSPSVIGVEFPLLLEAARRGDLTLLWLPESASIYEQTELEPFEPIHPPDQPLNTLDKPERQEALAEISRKILVALEDRGSIMKWGSQAQPPIDEPQLKAHPEEPATGGGQVPPRSVTYIKVAVSLLAGAMLAYLISRAGQWWGPKPPLENRVIRIDVKEKPLQEVFKEVARQIDATPAVDPKLTGTLSVKMSGEVKDFMNEICYEVGKCTWHIQPGDEPALVVLPPGAVPLPVGSGK